MNTCENPIAVPPRIVVADPRGLARAKAIALGAAQTMSGTARDMLFAYVMTGSAVASLAIIAAPHLEMLLPCISHGRG